VELGIEVVRLEVLLNATRGPRRVGRRRNEVGNGAGRVRGRVEPEVAAVAGEADAERHLARRRGARAVHGGGPLQSSQVELSCKFTVFRSCA